ncbi:unnamed protein product [Didymodactylos carnosus]|uniref:ATP-dependent DNA helicase n=1 Tax=Didymodactylos carnosus TaxID=1234261 RepID=A0A813VY06_9BILA|nr:unnamed protein product [Didymodactylos carnosus]CAF3630317.1 unnamed protein product [Didymodactylos carnosus]
MALQSADDDDLMILDDVDDQLLIEICQAAEQEKSPSRQVLHILLWVAVSKASVSTSLENDELIAIDFEIAELDSQIAHLYKQRSKLEQRKQELKRTLSNALKSSVHGFQKDAVENWRRTDYPWSKKVEHVLNTVFKLQTFRLWQLETINVTLFGKDCILIMPTGGGKSLCFQLPAVVSEGITICVSPLIALVEDQIHQLHALDIDARAINSSTSKTDAAAIMNILNNPNQNHQMKILYVTPEKLAKSKTMMTKLQKLYEMKQFARLVIDEVHCCSTWGHDFRPDFKYLNIFKRLFPKLPLLGLTATATTKVIEDVKQILNIPHCVLFKAPFNRKNLYYEVWRKDSAKDCMEDLARVITQRFDKQSGIVYCLSQKDSEDVCGYLQSYGIKAGCYHASLTGRARTQVHEKWLKNEVHVICATIAFGMGIDKPDVRFVIHHSLSKTIENFYQESGRAGRDDKQSHCLLFFKYSDVFRLACMALAEKSGNGLKNLYSIVDYCLNETRCRRDCIAEHFDEVFQAGDCHKMCDVCSRIRKATKKNCRSDAQIIIDYLKNTVTSKNRLTALKLFEQTTKLVSLNREDHQRLILRLLLDRYIKEDFHLTPYNSICYLIPGPRATRVNDLQCEIYLDVIETNKIATTVVKETTTTAEQPRKKQNILTVPKPKLRWVNDDKKVVDKPSLKRVLEYDDTDSDANENVAELNGEKAVKQHITSVITDEFDELDFL